MKTLYHFETQLELDHVLSVAEDGDTVVLSKYLDGQLQFIEVASPTYHEDGTLEYMVGTMSLKVGQLYIELSCGDGVNVVVGDIVYKIEMGYVSDNVIPISISCNQEKTDELRASQKVEDTFEETPVEGE